MATVSQQGIRPKPDSPRAPVSDEPGVPTRRQRATKLEAVESSSIESKIRAEEWALTIHLRRFVAFGLLGIITLNTIVTLTAIFFVGFGLMRLSDKVIFTLLGQTVAQIAATFLTVIKFLFPSKVAPGAKKP
jgi:hypothetical protein